MTSVPPGVGSALPLSLQCVRGHVSDVGEVVDECDEEIMGGEDGEMRFMRIMVVMKRYRRLLVKV